MEGLVAELGDVLRRSPKIAVEMTRVVAELPEGVRETAMRCLPRNEGVDAVE